MNSQNEYYRQKTKRFALEIIWLSETIPSTNAGNVLARQVLRSATSISINYKAVCTARSERERFAKLCIVVEEAEETAGWLELIEESGMLRGEKINILLQEAIELTKIFTAYRAKLRNPPNVTNHDP